MNDSTRILTGAVCACLLAAGATISAQEGVIRACAGPQGSLRIIGPGDSCRATETLATWNIQGPRGQDGANGAPGAPGAPGADGAPGPQGPPGASCEQPAPQAPQVAGDILIPDISMTPMPIYSFSWGASNPGSVTIGGGAGAGKVSFQDVAFVKRTDAVSPEFVIDVATGKHLKMAKVTIYEPGTTTAQAVYEFSDVIVTSFSTGAAGSGLPMESITLNFSRLAFGGECYDVKLNAKC